jgi:hypothetical protein
MNITNPRNASMDVKRGGCFGLGSFVELVAIQKVAFNEPMVAAKRVVLSSFDT